MDIRNFVTFNAVVEEDGFTKAASRLNYAQSTVTLHIKELEKHYDKPLFDRIGKKVFLTTFGQALYRQSSGLVASYHSILNIGDDGEVREVLRIGVYESLLRYRIYDLIQVFKQAHPHVDLIMHHGTCPSLGQMVRDGELDITFLLELDRPFADLHSELLCEEPFSLIFPEGKGKETFHQANQTVYLTEQECTYRLLFEDYLHSQQALKQHTMETGSVDLIKQYVGCGLGYSMVPTVTVKNPRDREGLSIVPFDNEEPMFTQLAYHKEKNVFPAMADFIDLVETYAKEWT